MIFGATAAADAAGAVLAHATLVGAVRWPKGRRLTAADAVAAVAAGVATLVVARLEAGDIDEDDAATRLAARLAGTNVLAAVAVHGRVNLIADADGVLCLAAATIDAVNAVDERITLGTLAPFARVAAGAVVATIKLIPFAVPGAVLDAALAVARPLTVAAFSARRFVLIQSRLAGTTAKMMTRTEAVTRARIERLGSRLDPGLTACAHDAPALAAALAAAPPDAVVLVAGASATADRRDVIPAAIEDAGGVVERLGMPIDPGNLLCLGTLFGRPVIGLPGCARSPKHNGFDLVLERLAAGLDVTDATIAAMGSGGLLPEAERPQPRLAGGDTAGAGRGIVGAIVLAAGRSTRMGAGNKLLADLNGVPVVARTVAALAAAGLPPPVVVVGHMADAVREAIADYPATMVVAADYADGMSRSLSVGLGAAPASWSAALIVLGDMPATLPATLGSIAAAAGDSDAVIVPVAGGRRGNPVAWGRAHWPRLAALTGDTGGRALFDTAAVTEVEVEDPGIFVDVDTPDALAALRATSPSV